MQFVNCAINILINTLFIGYLIIKNSHNPEKESSNSLVSGFESLGASSKIT